MAYASWSVVFGEQPSAAKWNTLGTNDSSFNDGTGIAALTQGATTAVRNSYKFSAYRNGAWTDGNGAFAKVQFETELYDTGSNYDSATNYRFVAPIAGFYHFDVTVASVVAGVQYSILALYKNGSVLRGLAQHTVPTGSNNVIQSGGATLQLAASDYIEVFHQGTGGAGLTGEVNTVFQGYYVSTT